MLVGFTPDPVTVMLGPQVTVLAVIVIGGRRPLILGAVMLIVDGQGGSGIVISNMAELQAADGAAFFVLAGI